MALPWVLHLPNAVEGVGGRCESNGSGWSCGVDLDASGTDVTYSLTTDDSGCWEAVEERPKGLPEREVTGCTGFLDYLSPDEPEG
jgi:hypothetical protein